jgi:type IV pilus assembly protein PilQ
MIKDKTMKQALKKTSMALVLGSIFSQGAIDVIAQQGLKALAITGPLATFGVMKQAQAAEITSHLTVKFNKEVAQPEIFAVTSKLFIDFDNAADNISGDPQIVPELEKNPLISNVETRKLGDKVRISISTRVPVHASFTKSGTDYVFDFQQASATEQAVNNYSDTTTVAGATAVAPVAVATSDTSTPAPVSQTVTGSVVNKQVKEPLTVTEGQRQKIIDHVNEVVSEQKANPSVITPGKTVTTVSAGTPVANTTNLTPAPAIVAAPVAMVGTAQIEHINLKRYIDHVAKLTLDLTNKDFTPNITKNGNLLLIDLKGVSIPPELQKTVNTKSLDTVVQSMDVATRDGNGRIVLEQKEGWDYSVYQMDRKLVIEVKPSNSDKNASQATYHGKPFSLNFQNMDIRSVLASLADFSGLNIITSDSVTGSMTIRLKDVPWDQALDLILESKNLEKVKQGNVIWIATREEIAAKNKAQLELNNQAAQLEPLKLEFFQLNHYKASELKDVLEGKSSNNSASGGSSSSDKKQGLGLISDRGSIGLDIRNNTLFIQDTESKLAEIRKLINRLDQPTRQVLIEAKLVIATDQFERDLGAQFGFGAKKRSGDTSFGLGNSYGDSQTLAGGTGTNGSGSTAFSLPVTGGGSLGFTILNAASGNFLSLELSALEQNNLGKVVSNPRLLTADNKKAIIRQGTEIPYVTPGSNNSPPTVSFKDAVLELDVTPQVSANGRVSMDLDITKDTVGQLVNVQGGGQVPSIDTRKITTQVTVDNGQTVVLGGIYEVTSADDLSKVPFFGDIPFVGNLFKNTSKTNQKVELLIFITPHVINDTDLDSINNDQQSADQFDFSANKK